MSYKWVFDVFSTYGVRFYEERDRSRTFINEDSDSFRELLTQFKALKLYSHWKNGDDDIEIPDDAVIRQAP